MTDPVDVNVDVSPAVNQALNKFLQGIRDESKFSRKRALETIKTQLSASFAGSDMTFTRDAIKGIYKASLTMIADPMERCRECACEIIMCILAHGDPWDGDMTASAVMTLMQRLGGKEVSEPSEEIRLQLYTFTHQLIAARHDHSVLEVNFSNLVAILVNALNDNYPEVKKMGCACSKLLANKLSASVFHMQSETLVKPLVANITHQHSRVRKDVVECLCDVIMHGNNKVVPDVVPHLAQRLFDQAQIVRLAVIKLVGNWLLDLPDRYSFQHRLIPLLLTGFVDESTDVRSSRRRSGGT